MRMPDQGWLVLQPVDMLGIVDFRYPRFRGATGLPKQ